MDTTKDETTFSEDSVIADTTFATTSEPSNNSEGKKSPNIGVRAGILIGGVTSLFVNFDSDEAAAVNSVDVTVAKDEPSQPTVTDENLSTQEEMTNPVWADDAMAVSKTVNDDMSFNEAFAAARAESGIGATFEWRGKIYGTYTAEEWANMTDENRTEFANHFAWDNIDTTDSSDVAQYSDAFNNGDITDGESATDDDIEIVSVQHPEKSDEVEVTMVKLDSADSSEVDVIGITNSEETINSEDMTNQPNEDIVVTQNDNDDSIIMDGFDRLTTPPGDLYAFND